MHSATFRPSRCCSIRQRTCSHTRALLTKCCFKPAMDVLRRDEPNFGPTFTIYYVRLGCALCRRPSNEVSARTRTIAHPRRSLRHHFALSSACTPRVSSICGVWRRASKIMHRIRRRICACVCSHMGRADHEHLSRQFFRPSGTSARTHPAIQWSQGAIFNVKPVKTASSANCTTTSHSC